ncbi:hypothetical protein [Phytoactinopolyspora mesophila]|uniref:ABC transporter substrate-binding protein n=1 Tax=Phytoactinopolyspora mesophila TaxID=2650750 RepID=A0A7K3M287_9ACTN|nr:hypothetical protein [Phytoactinopolyspora mesophila]NDL56538.1 hypothetical protein [Phytoactinopolyspora mesophila]
MTTTRAALIVSFIGLLAASCGSAEADGSPGANSSPEADVTATTTALSCAEITAFADRITDVGIMYDYQPSGSPRDLASENDVVFAGLLTGETADGSTEPDDEDGVGYVSFEIEVADVAVGADTIAVDDRVSVAVDYNPTDISAAEFREVAVAGIPVVVFANATDDDRGFVAALEGLMTACDGAEPIGLRGTTAGWADIESLDEVLSLARAGE